MGSHHHGVEQLGLSPSADHDAVNVARYPLHPCLGHDSTLEIGHQPSGILARSALHRPPDRASGDLQQAVVLVEPHERLGRIVADVTRGRRPDGGRLRQEVVLLEGGTIAAGGQVVAEIEVVVFNRRQVRRRLAVEAHKIAQHRPEPRSPQVRSLGEKGRQTVAAIFDPTAVQADGEAHVRGAGGDVEMIEEGDEVRIAGFVVDDEAHVHRDRTLPSGGFDCMCMTADIAATLEQGHIVRLGEKPRGGHARDSRPDHRDLHASSADWDGSLWRGGVSRVYERAHSPDQGIVVMIRSDPRPVEGA